MTVCIILCWVFLSHKAKLIFVEHYISRNHHFLCRRLHLSQPTKFFPSSEGFKVWSLRSAEMTRTKLSNDSGSVGFSTVSDPSVPAATA
ncbi:hypothetical protein R1flu_015498 [Riccia fluitans]|uniref:Secreted protein n=1 Tax=Riccia fluitans TaxID=41844 RepID=A0ABD1YJ89_9MARC